jgi:hypothetical protein
MIRFALVCDAGHGFEGWFRDNAAWQEQSGRGLVSCPQCGSVRVEKQIMAPAVARKDRAMSGPVPMQGPMPVASEVAPPTEVAQAAPDDAALRSMIRALRQHVRENSENVGDRFAEEARKIHYGDSEERSIYGSATPDETRALKEEGIGFHPLPRLPDEMN